MQETENVEIPVFFLPVVAWNRQYEWISIPAGTPPSMHVR